jgi:hypothetical protein
MIPVFKEKASMNPLLPIHGTNVVSVSISKEPCVITFVLKNSDRPLSVWFRSREVMQEAYDKWKMVSGFKEVQAFPLSSEPA